MDNICYRTVFRESFWKIVKEVIVVVWDIKFGILNITMMCLNMIVVFNDIIHLSM